MFGNNESFSLSADEESVKTLWFWGFQLFSWDDPIVVLIEIFENLSQVLWSFGQELVWDVILTESDVSVIIDIKGFQELIGNLLLIESLNVRILGESLNLTNTLFNWIEDWIILKWYLAWG